MENLNISPKIEQEVERQERAEKYQKGKELGDEIIASIADFEAKETYEQIDLLKDALANEHKRSGDYYVCEYLSARITDLEIDLEQQAAEAKRPNWDIYESQGISPEDLEPPNMQEAA